jgi:hypothetical protein
MAWIDRLIDSAPGKPEGVGALLVVLGGAVAVGVGLMLGNLPLLATGAAVLAVGRLGPAWYAMKQTANPPDTARSASRKADEGAAVDAFVQRMEAEGRYQAMVVANDEHPLRGRSR